MASVMTNTLFSLQIRLTLIPAASAIANRHDITIRRWDETRIDVIFSSSRPSFIAARGFALGARVLGTGGVHFEKKKRRKLAVLTVTESREYALSDSVFTAFGTKKLINLKHFWSLWYLTPTPSATAPTSYFRIFVGTYLKHWHLLFLTELTSLFATSPDVTTAAAVAFIKPTPTKLILAVCGKKYK